MNQMLKELESPNRKSKEYWIPIVITHECELEEIKKQLAT